jgi:hypothetical protein
VTDGRGAVVRARLQAGTFVQWPKGATGEPVAQVACAFPFAIDDIEGGEPPYSIKIAQHGRLRFGRDQADSLRLAIDNNGLTRVTAP